ncbi:septation ring formation regulator EzrA [uncultured Granulicatella sp.]|uniref:septation ring formation regulator EzrA n=1 Tax=uncultured Granulicatella sp. TaxID=316089 RepID=UPI0028E3030A|nr:septation ring formation regulator EzrA [uncultured Granulicatella sp.]
MGFVYFLLIIVVLGAIGYGVAHYLSQKQSKVIEELGVKKQKLMTVPIADILFTLKNLNLTGQTKRTYETWQATWQTITRFRFPEIEAALVSAEQYTQRLNFVKGSQISNQASQLIEETKAEVDKIYTALQKLLDSEKKNREELEVLQERYASMRKDLLAHSFSFGEALESLEKRLSYLELDFTKFNTLTNEGDHLEAKEVLGRIETEMQDFEQIVEEVPKYLKEIEEEYEDQVADLKEGYQKMVEEHYQFPKISIPAEIQKIEEIIAVAREHIRATELEEARQQLDKVAREIDQLYAVMENEIEAKAFVQRNRAQVERKLNQVLQSNRYVNIEVDRVAQNFVLANNEFNRVQEFAKQLEKEQEAVAYYSKALQNQQVPYSIVKEHYEIVLNTLKEIDENQLALVNTLNDLSQQEKSIRDGLDVFELDLRNMKRTIEKYHLPGLPKEYLELFFATSSRIEQLSQLMNRVKLDMTEITGLNQTIEDDVEKLDIMTEEIVDNAQLTEYMIQQANRYRLEHPEIDTAIQQSLEQFNHFYRYEESLAIIEKALNQVDPGSAQRVRDSYQSEKNNSLFF